MTVEFDAPRPRRTRDVFRHESDLEGRPRIDGRDAAVPDLVPGGGRDRRGLRYVHPGGESESDPADVTYTFLSDSAGPATITRTIPGLSRHTVNIEAEGLSIPDGPVATQITATLPVIAERAQYRPRSFDQWTETHNSFGVTEAGMKWGLAEGRAGGPESYQTYILLANAGTENGARAVAIPGRRRIRTRRRR